MQPSGTSVGYQGWNFSDSLNLTGFETAGERELEDPWGHKIFHLKFKTCRDLSRYWAAVLKLTNLKYILFSGTYSFVNMALPAACLTPL